MESEKRLFYRKLWGLAGFPVMGIAGVALATTVSRAIEFLLTLYENTKRSLVCIRAKYIRHSSAKLRKDFWRYTAPVLGNELVWGCGFTMFSVIMGHLGTDAVAANSVANILKNIIACVCNGIGTGAGIIVGNELGKGKLEQAREYGDRFFKLAIFTGAVSGIILLIVYFIVNMDEVIKLPAVYAHYKKYRWVRNLTENTASYNSERGAEIV